MPATLRTPQARLHSTPAYYLARPASLWITTLLRRHQPTETGRPERSTSANRAELPYRTSGGSTMNLICRWVHADDGALVMQWITTEGAAVHRGTDGNQAAYGLEMVDRDATWADAVLGKACGLPAAQSARGTAGFPVRPAKASAS
jgi:hypothetical protein